jgi:hypothetical protein
MFKYVLLAYMVLPLIGMYLMENGAYSIGLKINGFPNGAFIAYSLHFFTFFLSFFLITFFLKKLNFVGAYTSKKLYTSHFDKNFIWFCIISFVLILFIFGGYKVILGQVDKATFRVNLKFGAVFYLVVKSLLPAGLCYYALINAQYGKLTFKFYFCCLISAITVMGLGFKLFIVTLFLPTLLVLMIKTSFTSVTKLGIGVLSLLIFTTFIFDSDNQYGLSIFEYILTRATVLTADIPWYIWGSSPSELSKFPTANPFIGAIGRTPLQLMGISNIDYYLNYSYGPLITVFVGRSIESIINGSTVTGTLFSEGLFIFGHQFFFVLSIISGAFCGYCSMLLFKLKERKKYKYCAILATYIAFFVIGGVNSGDLSKLISFSTLMYIILSYIFLTLLDKRVLVK